MKLVRRLTFWLLVAIGGVFAVDTLVSVRHHLSLFERDMRRDERVLGRVLGRAVEQAWRDRGEHEALDLLEQLAADSPFRFRLVPSAGHGDLGAPGVAFDSTRPERSMTQVRQDGEVETRIYTYVPLAVPGRPGLALEVSEPFIEEERYLMERVRFRLVTAGALVLVGGGLAWMLGIRFVGRPVAQLVDKARRIGAGDFSGPLVVRGRDELSQLADEMNHMAANLDAAGRRLAEESAARIATLGQLRHADRLTTVGQLASGIAHELGTPLNVVSGRAKMILGGELRDDEELAHTSRVIVEQTERMARIVRQLLDFARRGGAEKCATDLARVARDTVTLIGPLAKRRGVELACREAGEPILVEADASQLQQALINLVMNSLQATPRGGRVTVQVLSHAAPLSRTPPRRPGPCAELRVSDEGSGISPQQRDAIFDPFFTTKPVGEGTGLGLSVAHGIVEEHGGWIEVESEPGQGSHFGLWLPREARDGRPRPDRR